MYVRVVHLALVWITLSESGKTENNILNQFPAILRGREGKMNRYIIQYLALNGPSVIYLVAKDLGSKSETRIHYPTVNRRMHDLVRQKYVQKAGTRTTKAGMTADLYATTLRGDFAALAGTAAQTDFTIDDSTDQLSPREVRQLIRNASSRKGSPFALMEFMLKESDPNSKGFIANVLVPEIAKAIKNGCIDLDAQDEGSICSKFASLVSQGVTDTFMKKFDSNLSDSSVGTEEKEVKQFSSILMSCLEKTLDSSYTDGKAKRVGGSKLKSPIDPPEKIERSEQTELTTHLSTSTSHQWVHELKVFLKLHFIGFD